MQREIGDQGTGLQIWVWKTLDKLSLGFLTFEMEMMIPDSQARGVPGKEETLHQRFLVSFGSTWVLLLGIRVDVSTHLSSPVSRTSALTKVRSDASLPHGTDSI